MVDRLLLRDRQPDIRVRPPCGARRAHELMYMNLTMCTQAWYPGGVMKEDLLTQMPHIQSVTADPSVRRDLEVTYRTLKVDQKVRPVKEFRNEIKTIREQASEGTIILVSEGGKLREASETTVVLSLATLQQMLTRAIERGHATGARRRGRPADFLVGLPKVPKSASKMDWEIDLGHEGPDEGSDLEI
jgi:hypothetical protein